MHGIIFALVVSVVYHVLESSHILIWVCKKYRNARGSVKIQSLSLFLSTKIFIGLEIAFI